MRTPLLVMAALAVFASPALAQDRTLPAGAYLAAQPPIDTIDRASVAPAVPVLEGRSVDGNGTAVIRKGSHHRR